MRNLRYAVLALMLAAGGCPTPYQESRFYNSGGYEDVALSGDRFHITVTANAQTSMGQVEQYFYRRAEELVQQHGYDGYEVVDLRTRMQYLPSGWGLPTASGIIQAYKGAAPTRAAGGSGSGVVVTAAGHLLTSNHVVEGCRELRTVLDGAPVPLDLLETDPQADLALLRIPAARAFLPAAFRNGRGLRPGDPVVALGFPLRSLLASDLNVTTGAVSALAGPGDDTRLLQVTAPVQPGSSGGPLLDARGDLIGIVVAKLDAVAVAARTGDIPQNVNFAIKDGVARDFLDAHGVDYEVSSSRGDMAAAEIAERGRAFTLPVECRV